MLLLRSSGPGIRRDAQAYRVADRAPALLPSLPTRYREDGDQSLTVLLELPQKKQTIHHCARQTTPQLAHSSFQIVRIRVCLAMPRPYLEP